MCTHQSQSIGRSSCGLDIEVSFRTDCWCMCFHKLRNSRRSRGLKAQGWCGSLSYQMYAQHYSAHILALARRSRRYPASDVEVLSIHVYPGVCALSKVDSPNVGMLSFRAYVRSRCAAYSSHALTSPDSCPPLVLSSRILSKW